MIQIAVIDANPERWRAAASRLRGAALIAPNEHAANADGIVYFQPPKPSDPGFEQVLQTGKYVLLGVADGWSSEDVAHWTSTPRVAIVNPDRYLPSRQILRQQLDAGKLGEVGLIRIHRWNSAASEAALLRDLDLILWYFAKTPTTVFAVENKHCMQIHLGFPDGGMAMLDHAHHLPGGDRYISLSVIGAHGAAYADDHANMQLAYQGGAARAIRTAEGVSQYATLLQAFVNSIVGHDSHRVEVSTWPSVLAVFDAVRQSLRTTQAVALEGALP